jgi:hypothetical protein
MDFILKVFEIIFFKTKFIKIKIKTKFLFIRHENKVTKKSSVFDYHLNQKKKKEF